jgi:hypothetical protein
VYYKDALSIAALDVGSPARLGWLHIIGEELGSTLSVRATLGCLDMVGKALGTRMALLCSRQISRPVDGEEERDTASRIMNDLAG